MEKSASIMNRLVLLLLFGLVFNFVACRPQSDSSKTLEEYYALGFPSIDYEWSEQDLEKAVRAIEDLRNNDEFALPRMNSIKSSKYFVKMIDELPKVDVNDSMNSNYQFQRFGRFEKLLKRLAFSYGPEERFQIFYSNEGIELDKLALLEVTKVGKLYQGVLNQMSEQKKIINKKNHDKFEGGIIKVYEASLETHQSYHKFNEEDKIELANVISENIVEIWGFLKDNSKRKLSEQIRRIAKENEVDEVQEIYLELLKELK